tara:strand:+ start:95 stop:400 length:306 start_codon:yes stop_codon:yes gene_type:complete
VDLEEVVGNKEMAVAKEEMVVEDLDSEYVVEVGRVKEKTVVLVETEVPMVMVVVMDLEEAVWDSVEEMEVFQVVDVVEGSEGAKEGILVMVEEKVASVERD